MMSVSKSEAFMLRKMKMYFVVDIIATHMKHCKKISKRTVSGEDIIDTVYELMNAATTALEAAQLEEAATGSSEEAQNVKEGLLECQCPMKMRWSILYKRYTFKFAATTDKYNLKPGIQEWRYWDTYVFPKRAHTSHVKQIQNILKKAKVEEERIIFHKSKDHYLRFIKGAVEALMDHRPRVEAEKLKTYDRFLAHITGGAVQPPQPDTLGSPPPPTSFKGLFPKQKETNTWWDEIRVRLNSGQRALRSAAE